MPTTTTSASSAFTHDVTLQRTDCRLTPIKAEVEARSPDAAVGILLQYLASQGPVEHLALGDADLRGLDLSGGVFRNCTFGVRETGGNGVTTRIKGPSVEGTSFAGASFDACEFLGLLADAGTSFESAAFLNCKAEGCTLSRANFDRATVRSSRFAQSHLRSLRAASSTWTSVRFTHCDTTSWVAPMANLSAVDGLEGLVNSMDLTDHQKAAVRMYSHRGDRALAEAHYLALTDPDGVAARMTAAAGPSPWGR